MSASSAGIHTRKDSMTVVGEKSSEAVIPAFAGQAISFQQSAFATPDEIGAWHQA
jgi:hypothetical protein